MNDCISPIRTKIVIDQTTGERGKLLHQAFFLATDVEGVYSFYSKQGKIRAANIVSGQDFNFTIDDLNYHVIKFHIDDDAASGEWLIDNDANEPEGTFQAQSGGVLTGSEEGASADARPSNAIYIHDNGVTGGADKDKLKHCYFLPTAVGGPYDFYNKHDNLLKTGLTTNTNWSVTHDSIDWTITNFVISDTEASGDWSNPNSLSNEQDGTFQAQSGGVPEGEESAAAASA
jgi:hypothetical protein